MHHDFSLFLPCSMLHSCVLSAVLFCISLKKRPYFGTRLVLGIFLGGILSVSLPGLRVFLTKLLRLENIPHNLVLYAMHTLNDVLPVLLMSFGLIYFCCEILPSKAFYAATLAHLTQAIAFSLFLVIFPQYSHPPHDAQSWQIVGTEYGVAVLVYAAVYVAVAKKMAQDGTYPFHCVYHAMLLSVVILVDRYFNIVSVRLLELQHSLVFSFLVIHDLILSVVLLLTQVLHRNVTKFSADLEIQSRVQALQQKEYRIFQDNMAALNHKFHDLRHLIRGLRFCTDADRSAMALQELEENIAVHDCAMNTGNEALDVLLSAAWLRCEHRDIRWTCMADGSAVDFLPPTDLYVMLENALENAMEAAVLATDPEERFLSVTIRRVHRFGCVRIENFCPADTKFSDGLPVTTKNDSALHGYGTRSIRGICEKYRGECRMYIREKTFITELLLPIPTGRNSPHA